MTLSDEQISAFLDAELPQDEMEYVRNLIATDGNIAARVESFAIVDVKLKSVYSQIDSRPLPDAIEKLLSSPEPIVSGSHQQTTHNKTENEKPTAKILMFPKVRQWAAQNIKPTAVAACFIFVLGYGMVSMKEGVESNNNSSIAAHTQVLLDAVPSGNPVRNETGELIVNLSFKNKSDQYCRQYTQQSTLDSTDNIACKVSGEWELVASLPRLNAQGDEYATASNSQAVDSVIDSIISGPIVSPQDEIIFIQRGW